MSLDGRVRRHGSTATVYHAVDTIAADRSTTRTYPTYTPDVRILLEDLSDELVRRVFGAETKAALRGIVTDRTVVLNKDDGILVTAGLHAGERFTIAGRLLQQSGASPHREVALAETSEVFP